MREHCFTAEKSLPPLPCTRIFGRELQALTIAGLLQSSRLLTLTGVAGCGKSRLALQVVTAVSGQRVYWGELATLSNPGWLPRAIATICLPDEPLGPVSGASLARLLGSREALLVLNNCEHLIAACSALVEVLLPACPHLRILLTSRETLNLAGETIYVVPPLPFPAPAEIQTSAHARQFAAVQLFVERATQVLPAFEPTPEQIQTIVQICQRLDGVPLAIEMAAARLRILSPEQIAARLDDCCQLLSAGYRTALPHHRSLAAALDWSYDRLSPGERTLLQALSPLAGSASLETVEQLCGRTEIAGQAILDVLASLVNKSLVVVARNGRYSSYRLLEMQRQYIRWRTAGENAHAAGGTQHLRLLALGHARILIATPTSVDWRYAKARELLFYLLCHPTRSKEQIGLALWPDASASQVRQSFHTALYHLRQVLGRAEWILFRQDLYSFNRTLDYWFDVEAFERHLGLAHQLQTQEPVQAIAHLEEGISLYQGDFLEGAAMGDWFLPRQRELKKLYQQALLTLGQLFSGNGEYPQAIETYQRLIEHDSLQEIAHRELMRCHARQGERSQALRHYQILRDLLRRELQACPAPETVDLFERLRNGDAI
jgi:predicted ATPase/DNA-binding SARP family transcriptional activator